jgi:hypothetical protein
MTKGLRNHQPIVVAGDAWIQQRQQPLETQKSSTNWCHVWRKDSTVQTAPRDLKIMNEVLPRKTYGLDSQNKP